MAIKKRPKPPIKAVEDSEKATTSPILQYEALMGNIEMVTEGDSVIELSAATLNAADPVSQYADTGACLKHPDGRTHDWIDDHYVDLLVQAYYELEKTGPNVPDLREYWADGSVVSPMALPTGTSNQWAAGVAATGKLTCPAGTQLSAGAGFTLIGAGLVGGYDQSFEYQTAGGSPDDASAQVITYAPGDTGTQIAAATAAKIMEVRSDLKILATANGADIDLTQDLVGGDGNTAIALKGYGLSGEAFENGLADKIEVTYSVESSEGAGDDTMPFGTKVSPVTQRFVCR